MNKEVYREMCNQIYEGESWDRMINCLERKDKEIERLNNIIEEKTYLYNKLSTESEYAINKLNNIIDELEKYIKTEAKVELYGDKTGLRTFANVNDILDKLKELKGE